MACTAGAAFLFVTGSFLVRSASGQATPPAKPAPAAMDDDDNGPVMHRHKMTDVELGRLRMLEIQSGAFHAAHEEATAQQVIGPPLSDREKVLHAINRLTFGPKTGEVQKILEDAAANSDKDKTEAWLAWAKVQMDADKIDDHALDEELAKRFPWIKMSIQEVHKAYPYKTETGPSWTVIRDGLPKEILLRAATSNRQFKEVMCEFWRNHFCIDNSPGEAKTRSWAAVRYEEDVIRKNVFGKFKNMLFASATHPAMLEYLDNHISRKDNWNENYAREVMELHTLGVDHGYNNYDVQELSKVLTGWTYSKTSYNFEFMAGEHQPGIKTFLGVRIPEGYNGGEQALYMLATHKNTADFISYKLCQYLVNDAPPATLVAKVSSVFMQTEGDLPKMYMAIVTSPEFVSRENYRAKFKTPFAFVVSALRATDSTIDDESESTLELAKMGQPIYNCQDPTGYYFKAESWLDSGVLTSRWDYSLSLLRGNVKGIKPSDAFINHYKSMKVEDELKSMVRDLIGDDIGDRTRLTLVKAATDNDHARMLAVLLGSPSFQQY
jgi:hypothetical protein